MKEKSRKNTETIYSTNKKRLTTNQTLAKGDETRIWFAFTTKRGQKGTGENIAYIMVAIIYGKTAFAREQYHRIITETLYSFFLKYFASIFQENANP